MSLFPSAVAEFKISDQILPQRKFVIMSYNHDSNKDCMIKFNKRFFLEPKETVRQVVSNFLCGDVKRDILNSATAVRNRLTFLS